MRPEPGHGSGSKLAALFESLLAFGAAVIPFAVAVARAASSAQWRSDIPALRDQGLVAVAFGGGVSTPATQALSLLPLGSHAFRAALVSALGLALGCVALRRIAARMLAGIVSSRVLIALLAAVAALSAGLSPSWQTEATIGGGASVAAGLALCALDLVTSLGDEQRAMLAPESSRRWLWLAALGGAIVAENLPCGIALVCATLVTCVVASKRPPARLVPALILAFIASAVLLSAPLWLRPLAPRSLADLGRALSAASLTSLTADPSRKTALYAWSEELGTVSLMLAAGGVAVGLFRAQLRAASGALVALALADLVYPLTAAPKLSADPLAALRMLALAAFAVAASLGAAEAVATLTRLRLPMGRPASALLIVFYVTVVGVASEEAAFVADRSEHFAADAWTDQALGGLPLGSALLVHSPALAWRVWTAQTRGGQRPDVLVIPAPLIERGLVPHNLRVGEEPAGQVLRDLALAGQASEFGLSLLADARPLHVELDPRWDKRVAKHLSVEGAWLRYAPQILGPSDHLPPVRHPLGADGRVARALEMSAAPDPSSQGVLVRTLKEHTTTLALAGMGDASRAWLDGLDQLAPDDPFVTGARLRLAYAAQAQKNHHSIDLRDLLRF